MQPPHLHLSILVDEIEVGLLVDPPPRLVDDLRSSKGWRVVAYRLAGATCKWNKYGWVWLAGDRGAHTDSHDLAAQVRAELICITRAIFVRTEALQLSERITQSVLVLVGDNSFNTAPVTEAMRDSLSTRHEAVCFTITFEFGLNFVQILHYHIRLPICLYSRKTDDRVSLADRDQVLDKSIAVRT